MLQPELVHPRMVVSFLLVQAHKPRSTVWQKRERSRGAERVEVETAGAPSDVRFNKAARMPKFYVARAEANNSGRIPVPTLRTC